MCPKPPRFLPGLNFFHRVPVSGISFFLAERQRKMIFRDKMTTRFPGDAGPFPPCRFRVRAAMSGRSDRTYHCPVKSRPGTTPHERERAGVHPKAYPDTAKGEQSTVDPGIAPSDKKRGKSLFSWTNVKFTHFCRHLCNRHEIGTKKRNMRKKIAFRTASIVSLTTKTAENGHI